ncbi:ATP-dependent helicase HrpB [Paenibacillus shirakamiensis]|uniref:ATP-dependent helicase HrpB n=1 Tax=Paenibacillus shirakamiensis TaxID=1265935 RepID=A0ABS4JIQ6_9BACL|nr:ATP-dependent helicase HrpB [Paenibacillus shirakamiensis]MBP2000995.1 ATP-dependent helicase HrpB [Paenibacillus shirakamiensis]
MLQYPIDEVMPELKTALRQNTAAILVAEPGAGKTTRVPLALLEEEWLQDQDIILLEPRRLAARSAAIYMSNQQGEQVGGTVGYRIRQESHTSANTRITVVTEGILTRMLQSDPSLPGVGLLIFDEFHERNLHADLGLALSLECQQLLREDLRILIMSATLDAEPISNLLNHAPIVQSSGTMFPVETRYLPQSKSGSTQPMEQLMANTILAAIQRDKGSLLAFLPGVREIRRVEQQLLQSGELPSSIHIVRLYGNMTQQQQAEAIQKAPEGERKIVLSTSIAESSLTVEGIHIVVDAGLRRTQLFSSRTGMGKMTTIRAARDSADQRRGRAGRTAPGVCYRLWTESEHQLMASRTTPEILEADLTSLALELAVWGVRDPAELCWLDQPQESRYQHAIQLLIQLGAVDKDGKITSHGKAMAYLAIHPRLAHMVLVAKALGYGRVACYVAIVLEEKSRLKLDEQDIRTSVERVMLLVTGRRSSSSETWHGEEAQLLRSTKELMKRLGLEDEVEHSVEEAMDKCGLLCSLAYPDRIGKRRADGRYVLRNGRGAEFRRQQPISSSEYIVAVEVEDSGMESSILMAAPLDEGDILDFYQPELEQVREIAYDQRGKFTARTLKKLGAIILSETRNQPPTQEEMQKAMLDAIRSDGLSILPWTDKCIQLQQRAILLGRYLDKDWPDYTEEALLLKAEEWLYPYLDGIRNRNDVQRLPLYQMLLNLLTWTQQQILDEQAPTHFVVPSGSRIPIQYGTEYPYIAVRLQEMFGLTDTPKIAYKELPLTLHLLSPASRPVQVTSDLRSFWNTTYFEIKKDLKGRYPKHYWPDQPLEAIATRKVRPPSN